MEIRAFAKINLFLQVTGKRPDGYHTLRTLMCPVDLYDTLTFGFHNAGIQVTCSDSDLPKDKENLAGVAAERFYAALEESGRRERPAVQVFIQKRIPVAGGLGGGSSDAAAVLTALNRHYNNAFSEVQLRNIGSTIGADVPFFLLGKPALGLGIGDELYPYPLHRPFTTLLVNTGVGVSTAKVYKAFKLGLTKCEEKLKNFTFESSFNPGIHLCNDLETVTENQHPEIRKVKSLLMTHGALGSLMSGSGPTVFGLFDDTDAARNALSQMPTETSWRFFMANTLDAVAD